MKKFIRRRILILNIAVVILAVLILWHFNFGKFSYLMSCILIAGSAVFHLWVKDGKLLSKHIKFIGIVFVVGIILAFFGETAALKLHIWGYNPDKTLNIYVGPAIESFLFNSLVFIAIASATIRISNREESFLKG